jgi:hypothetical protein
MKLAGMLYLATIDVQGGLRGVPLLSAPARLAFSAANPPVNPSGGSRFIDPSLR